MSYADSVVAAESGGNPNSQDPNSSASGPAGFINSTWLSTIKAARPDLAEGKSDQELLSLKSDPVLAPQMAEYYGNQNGAFLQKNGLPVTDGTKYLAHFAGPGGAVKILQADPSASASDILGPKVLKANPFLQGMTAQDLQAWAAKKAGVQLPQPGVQNNAPAAAPAPTNAIPPQPQPILPQAPQAPQQPQQAAFDPGGVAPTAPPIFPPQRKPINLAGLMAAFKAPSFYRG